MDKTDVVKAKKWRPIMIVRLVIGVVIGAGLGFAYYKFVGCSSGSCPLTSNPYISSLYGALMGGLLSMQG
jgi:hypothetical protein